MIGMVIASLAIVVAFGALWLAGGANSKAEFQQQQFYDAHIKSIKSAMKEMARSVQTNSAGMTELEKSSGKAALKELEAKVDLLTERLAHISSQVDKISSDS